MNHSTALSEETKRSVSVLLVIPTTNFLLPYQDIKCQLDDAACVNKHIKFQDKVTQVYFYYLHSSSTHYVALLCSGLL